MECKWYKGLSGKRVYGIFDNADADIFCIQETKVQQGQVQLDLDGYYQYWNYAVKKVILVLHFFKAKAVIRCGWNWNK